MLCRASLLYVDLLRGCPDMLTEPYDYQKFEDYLHTITEEEKIIKILLLINEKENMQE